MHFMEQVPRPQQPTDDLYPETNPVQSFLSYFSKINFNIIWPSMPRSIKWCPSYRFSI